MLKRTRVVSLNTWKCDGSYLKRLEWMSGGLRALAPDIVFLQEAFVCEETGDDTAEFLGSALNLHVTQVTGREKLRLHLGEMRNSRSNLALLTRTLPVHQETVQLAPCDGDEDRMVQIVDLPMSGQLIRLANTHLTHVKGYEGDIARAVQAEQLLNAAEPPIAGLSIFGGDLNARPHEAAIQKLANASGIIERENDDITGTFQGESADQTTCTETLDYLFLRQNDSTKAGRILHLWQALDTPIGPNRLFPSDHAAVVADVCISEQEQAC